MAKAESAERLIVVTRMNELLRQLNNYVGALLLAATIGLAGYTISAMAQLSALERTVTHHAEFIDQQRRINESVAILAQHVAVLQDRQSR